MATVSGLPVADPVGASRGGVIDLLDRLDDEQRAAALLPDGPAQIIAPAGSGKTMTLIAQLGVLLARGVAANRICVVTFNRDAAAELVTRISARLLPLVPTADEIEVRTLHGLARHILLDAGAPAILISDRLPLLRAVLRRAASEEGSDDPLQPSPALLDTAISAWKVEGRTPQHPDLVEAYEALLRLRGAVDFGDFIVGAVRRLERNAALRGRW